MSDEWWDNGEPVYLDDLRLDLVGIAPVTSYAAECTLCSWWSTSSSSRTLVERAVQHELAHRKPGDSGVVSS